MKNLAQLRKDNPGRLYYVCQSCKKNSTDASLFLLVKIDKVGFVYCKECWS